MALYTATQQALAAVLTGEGFSLVSTDDVDAAVTTLWGGLQVSMNSIAITFAKAGFKCDWDTRRVQGKGWEFFAPVNLIDSQASTLVVIKVEA